VNNSADAYFVQLKRDSTIRAAAEKGVQVLSGLFSDKLIARRREQLMQNGGEFETSRDEMILPNNFQGDEQVDKSYTGVS